MEKLNNTMLPKLNILPYRQKSVAEEETKSSSKVDSLAVDSEENLCDSFFGSMSEGRESILIQKVPHLQCLLNFNSASPTSEDINLSLYKAVLANNVEACKEILTQSHPSTSVQ